MKPLVTVTALTGLLAIAACEKPLPTAGGSGTDQIAAFAHESNNRAELFGSQNGNPITGTSIVNFTGNRGNAWRSNVMLTGVLMPGTYSFYAISPDGTNRMLVCTFTLAPTGRQGCSADTNIGGFLTAEVEDGTGAVIASGTYERRGGNRFKG